MLQFEANNEIIGTVTGEKFGVLVITNGVHLDTGYVGLQVTRAAYSDFYQFGGEGSTDGTLKGDDIEMNLYGGDRPNDAPSAVLCKKSA